MNHVIRVTFKYLFLSGDPVNLFTKLMWKHSETQLQETFHCQLKKFYLISFCNRSTLRDHPETNEEKLLMNKVEYYIFVTSAFTLMKIFPLSTVCSFHSLDSLNKYSLGNICHIQNFEFVLYIWYTKAITMSRIMSQRYRAYWTHRSKWRV